MRLRVPPDMCMFLKNTVSVNKFSEFSEKNDFQPKFVRVQRLNSKDNVFLLKVAQIWIIYLKHTIHLLRTTQFS